MNVLMIHEENKSRYVHIKSFNRLMFNKTKHGGRGNGFAQVVCNILVAKVF